MASGKYIAILNSDDAFMPGKLEAQVVYLDEHPEAGAVLTGVAVIDENGDPLHDSGSFYFNIFEQPNRTRREWLRHFFYFGNCLCIPSAMIRRECYDRIGVPDRRFHQLPDWDFWVKLCFEYEMYILPEILTRFRVMKDHGNASGRRPEAEIRSYWEFLQVLRNYLRISSVYELQLIFPEAAEIIGPDGSCEEELIPFVLAQLALRKNDERWSFFALQVLFELMGDEKKAEKLKRRFGFSYRNLIGLTGKIDCFHLRDRMASPVPAEGAAE